ncbi:carbohydrate ABC transporter permease [Geochorda subterranea]|uniref:Carbohydrate ABC transporter permease n=1 Tax=Geochorda subterranea TaxID=3109564 RepID=A0ABZ1BQ82_9FIRM|nr:carbohydrate ABC transporter permease [Limnochorda sp. LNt]WRP14964.1 carbohydrate ABC transporter permease [Limnochorda sp. LNt]
MRTVAEVGDGRRGLAPERRIRTRKGAARRRRVLKAAAGYLSLTVLGVAFALPFLWMVSTAFKEPWQTFQIPPVWIPSPVTLDNFIVGWTAVPFNRYILNTVIITAGATLGTVLSATLVAYGFSRFRAPGRELLFGVVVSTMMLPPQVTIVPTYMLFNWLGWVDTFKPLIVPSYLGGGAFNIFLLRQFFRTIPMELDEAARIDGCGSWGILWRIIVPLSKPALTTVGVFSIVYHWNDFFNPLIYLNSESRYTLSIGLKYFQNAYGATEINLLMAVSLIALVPILIIFFVAQKYFVQGITMTGLKG